MVAMPGSIISVDKADKDTMSAIRIVNSIVDNLSDAFWFLMSKLT